MSVALLLLLPILISGYIFSTKCRFTYYRVMRLEGYHLYFNAANYGSMMVLLAGISYLIVYHISPDCIMSFAGSIKGAFESRFSAQNTVTFDLILVGIWSVILAYVLSGIANHLIDDEYSFSKAIENDDFELLLFDASAEERLISVTTESKKVYVGNVVRGFEPSEERKFLRLLPLMSGYRTGKGKVIFTTRYQKIIKAFGLGSISDLDVKHFEIILPVSDIKSANIFDPDVYQTFQDLDQVP